MGKLLRVNDSILAMLEQLEQEMGASKQTILHSVLEQFMKQRVIDEINAAYFELKQDPEKWKHELEERALWDSTSNDGLDDL